MNRSGLGNRNDQYQNTRNNRTGQSQNQQQWDNQNDAQKQETGQNRLESRNGGRSGKKLVKNANFLHQYVARS